MIKIYRQFNKQKVPLIAAGKSISFKQKQISFRDVHIKSRQETKVQPSVKRILFTGGPCAGKTTVQTKLTQSLTEQGFRVFCVPEAATLLAKGGAQLNTSQKGWDFQAQMQLSLCKAQMHLEDIFTEIAVNEFYESLKPSVVLCDRGLFDGSAYVKSEMWHQILDDQGWSGLNFIEKRYDAIIHMVTAAEGAEEFYNFSNEARYESAQEARVRDHSLRKAYLGHS